MTFLRCMALAGLLAVPLSAQSPAEPFGFALVDAFNQGDTQALKDSCVDSFWNTDGDSPQKLIREGYGTGTRAWNLQLVGIEEAPGRAVATLVVWSVSREMPVDAVYFYAEDRGSGWLWYRFNEDKLFKKAFLEGLIDAEFDPKGLPSHPELDALGPHLKAFFAAVTEETEEVEAPQDGAFLMGEAESSKVPPYLLTSVGAPVQVKSYWFDPLQKGALVVSGPAAEDGYAETVVLYFQRANGTWLLVGAAAWLSASGLLSDQ